MFALVTSRTWSALDAREQAKALSGLEVPSVTMVTVLHGRGNFPHKWTNLVDGGA